MQKQGNTAGIPPPRPRRRSAFEDVHDEQPSYPNISEFHPRVRKGSPAIYYPHPSGEDVQPSMGFRRLAPGLSNYRSEQPRSPIAHSHSGLHGDHSGMHSGHGVHSGHSGVHGGMHSGVHSGAHHSGAHGSHGGGHGVHNGVHGGVHGVHNGSHGGVHGGAHNEVHGGQDSGAHGGHLQEDSHGLTEHGHCRGCIHPSYPRLDQSDLSALSSASSLSQLSPLSSLSSAAALVSSVNTASLWNREPPMMADDIVTRPYRSSSRASSCSFGPSVTGESSSSSYQSGQCSGQSGQSFPQVSPYVVSTWESLAALSCPPSSSGPRKRLRPLSSSAESPESSLSSALLTSRLNLSPQQHGFPRASSPSLTYSPSGRISRSSFRRLSVPLRPTGSFNNSPKFAVNHLSSSTNSPSHRRSSLAPVSPLPQPMSNPPP